MNARSNNRNATSIRTGTMSKKKLGNGDGIFKMGDSARYKTFKRQENADCDSLDQVESSPLPHTTSAEVLTTAVVLELTDQELKRNRTFMTVVHFLLTYPRWSFSLFLLLASGSLSETLPTAQEAVRDPIQNLRALVSIESQAYYECTTHFFDAAEVVLNETVQEERVKYLEIRQDNLDLLQENTTTIVDTCVLSTHLAQRALNHWHQQQVSHNIPWIHDNDTCTYQDRESLVGSAAFQDGREANMIALTHQIDDRLSTWRLQSMDAVSRLSRYAQSRSAYDYDYFVGAKVGRALDLLGVWQVSVAKVELPALPETYLLDHLRSLLQGLIDILQDARVRIDILKTRLASFYASIRDFRTSYLDLYYRLSLASSFVKDFLPPRVDLPKFLDMSTVPVVDLLMPNVFSMPRFDADLPSVDVTHILNSILQVIESVARDMLQQASATFQKLLQELLESLQELFQLEDYNPPEYTGFASSTMDQELQKMDESHEEIQQEIDQMVRDSLQDIPGDSFKQFSKNATTLRVDLPEFPDVQGGNATSFSYLEPSFPSFSIPKAIEAFFTFVLVHQWVVELVIQFFRMVGLKRKYEKNATPDLPEIDLVCDEDNNETYNESTWTLVKLALLEHLLTPWMTIGLVLFPFAFVGVIWWFPHVKQSCIDSREGTLMARNMFAPILINKASFAGNAHHVLAEQSCRRRQRNLCSSNYHESDRLYRTDLFSLHSLEIQYNESLGKQDEIFRCIDLSILDQVFLDACCGLDGYTQGCTGPGIPESCPIDNRTEPPTAFPPLGRILDQSLCTHDALDWWNLKDSHFDCQALYEICESSSCLGVNAERIRQTTIETDCQVETYIIQCCMLVLLALFHGIVVNLISSLAFNGVKRLRWRHLKPDGLKLRTQVLEDGTLVRGDDQNERMDRIQRALARFHLVGQVQLVLAMVLLVVWLVSFFVLQWLTRYFGLSRH